MRIKELFTVPNGKKVTEKAFARVLVSSICSILLCMACLAGTTWAWFTVSIENTGNVIQTAEVPKYILQVDGQSFISGENLPVGEHTVSIAHASNADDLQKKSQLYVTFILDSNPYGYIVLGGDASESVTVIIKTDSECCLSWTVSWFAPGSQDVIPLVDNLIEIYEEDPTEETTEHTEETTEGTDATEESTAATDPTEESTTATDPTEASTAATEATTEAATGPETSEEPTGSPASDDTSEPATASTDAPVATEAVASNATDPAASSSEG